MASLLLSYFNNVSSGDYLSPEDVEQIIQRSALDGQGRQGETVGYDQRSGWGLVQAGAAMQSSQAQFAYSTYIQKGVLDVPASSSNNPLSVNLFPNPASSKVTLTFDLPKTCNVGLSITDLQGHILLDYPKGKLGSGPHSITLDVQGFARGMYLCKLVTGDEIVTKKWVKAI